MIAQVRQPKEKGSRRWDIKGVNEVVIKTEDGDSAVTVRQDGDGIIISDRRGNVIVRRRRT